MLYRAGELIYVRPVSGGMWVAQLREPIIKISGGRSGVRFNKDRPQVRYFVLTADLGSYPHAIAFWRDGKGGAARVLADETAALQRAHESGGVHFSFEKLDRVTRTAVRGRFSAISEEVHHRSSLVSFALSEEALAEARAATCGGEHHRIEEEEEQLLYQEADVEAAAAALAAAALEREAAQAERERRLEARRERKRERAVPHKRG